MIREEKIGTQCSSCCRPFETTACSLVNVAGDPELKQRVLSGEFFVQECPYCGHKELMHRPFVYIDPDQKLLLMLSHDSVKVDDLNGFTGRWTDSAGELMEKILVFDAGLDDLVVEMCKYVTCQELKKDVTLKFVRMDGADNEITFTYPEKGEMQMVCVGFNVYEDCAAILGRHPEINEAARGMVHLDAAWLSDYIG